ncbi:hypothetical protein C8A00DRAFT_35400 [Chaetomidium leptoderma]|uniref:Uncharacterized protein n=1 Tax=Chaetomidium leptoderma TaxID=669021 RepID=A0AAN6ZVL7_9PEZI|nr:hypothetical protein C8A00DRAFT_35400 [Chaetomidium leptoderma]
MVANDSNQHRKLREEKTPSVGLLPPSSASRPPSSPPSWPPSSPPSTAPSSMASLPVELMLEIAGSLTSASEIKPLAMTCREAYTLLNPLLYRYNTRAQGTSAALLACEHGRVNTLERLCENDAKFDLVAEEKPRRSRGPPVRFAPIHVAAKHGRVEVLSWLVANGANLDALNQNFCGCPSLSSRRPFSSALRSGGHCTRPSATATPTPPSSHPAWRFSHRVADERRSSTPPPPATPFDLALRRGAFGCAMKLFKTGHQFKSYLDRLPTLQHVAMRYPSATWDSTESAWHTTPTLFSALLTAGGAQANKPDRRGRTPLWYFAVEAITHNAFSRANSSRNNNNNNNSHNNSSNTDPSPATFAARKQPLLATVQTTLHLFLGHGAPT